MFETIFCLVAMLFNLWVNACVAHVRSALFCDCQENGHDSDLKSLRSVLQQCEATGMVDFELGGHTFSRPAAVVQGLSADKFLALIKSFLFNFKPLSFVVLRISPQQYVYDGWCRVCTRGLMFPSRQVAAWSGGPTTSRSQACGRPMLQASSCQAAWILRQR